MSSTHTVGTLSYITPQNLATLLKDPATRKTVAVVDARDADYVGGHIAGADNVPKHKHDYRMPELVRTLRDKDTVVFHCALSQQRGPEGALAYLRERERLSGKGETGMRKDGTDAKDVQRVVVLEGGFHMWVQLYGRDPDLTEAYDAEIWEQD